MKQILALAAVVLLSFIAFTLVKVVRSQERNVPGQEPIVEYAAIEALDSENAHLRARRSCRYDKQNSKHIEELPIGIEPLPEIDHWLVRLPALPVTKSDTVLVGKVVSAKAYLSNDKTGIYSEFNIGVETILKDDSGVVPAAGNTIAAERAGGAVRFPSGRVQRYGILNQGTPKIGVRYVLFLKRSEEGQDFLILTAYELREGYVYPLDGRSESGSKTNLAFSAYEGTEESVFLNALRKAISQSTKAPGVDEKIR